jgi:predicted flavoprotein YhiN
LNKHRNKTKILNEHIITDLNKHRNKTKILNELEKNSIKQIISNIGEPFLKKKIFDMYFSLFDENESEIAMLEREKEALIAKIQKLKNDTN